jgi:uncharacterized protein YqgV (UPF0045/DUF77 family)
MEAAIEISMYPLTDQYIPPILSIIKRLESYDGIRVNKTELSTQVFGDYDQLMEIMSTEIKRSFQEGGDAVMVLKIVHAND